MQHRAFKPGLLRQGGARAGSDYRAGLQSAGIVCYTDVRNRLETPSQVQVPSQATGRRDWCRKTGGTATDPMRLRVLSSGVDPTPRMSPPKASLAKDSADSPKGAPPSPAARVPAPTLPQQLGNEQMLNGLRARQAKASGAPSPDERIDGPDDAWRALSAEGRARVKALYAECARMMMDLNDAQTGYTSLRRSDWILGLAQLQRQLNALDSDAKIASVARAFENYSENIFKAVEGFGRERLLLERRYGEELDWLRFQRVEDSTLAADHLERLYAEFRNRVDRGGAEAYITSEDYSEIKNALDSGSHRALGTLQASRRRAHDAHRLLDVVRELRVDHQNPDNNVPDWRKLVDDEVQELDQLSKRPPATRGSDASAQYVELRNDLRKQREAVLQVIATEDSKDAIKKAANNNPAVMIAEAAVGAAEAIVEPLLELAREILDDVQIGLFYLSGERYTPKFTSDLMKAFEHGASRTDEGLIGTPGRLLKAAEAGNWEEVGREAMNLYGLVELVRASPKYLGKASAALGITRLAARIVRAHRFGLRLRAPRFRITSQPPKVPSVPREPVYLGNDPAIETRPNPQRGTGAPPPRYGPTEPPPRLPDRPTFLVDSPKSAPKPHDWPPKLPTLVPPAAIAELRNLILDAQKTGARTGTTTHGVLVDGIEAFTNQDGTLTAYYDMIQNVDRDPGAGRLMHIAFEEAAKAAARAKGATKVRVAVGTIQNERWDAHLASRGYAIDVIETPGRYSRVRLRTWTVTPSHLPPEPKFLVTPPSTLPPSKAPRIDASTPSQKTGESGGESGSGTRSSGALDTIFEQLGGRKLGYTVKICDDSTVVETTTGFHNVGLFAKDQGGAFTDPLTKTVWIHESVVAAGGATRRWGRLTLSQVVAHELGHIHGGFDCAQASRIGANLPGLTATERQGLLNDASNIEKVTHR
jgi:hypothetical protein